VRSAARLYRTVRGHSTGHSTARSTGRRPAGPPRHVAIPVGPLLDEVDDLLAAGRHPAPAVWIPDPGARVLAVSDRFGRRWRRAGSDPTPRAALWRHTDPTSGDVLELCWGELLQHHAPLTDATSEEMPRG
jgi:hypothetical protein